MFGVKLIADAEEEQDRVKVYVWDEGQLAAHLEWFNMVAVGQHDEIRELVRSETTRVQLAAVEVVQQHRENCGWRVINYDLPSQKNTY